MLHQSTMSVPILQTQHYRLMIASLLKYSSNLRQKMRHELHRGVTTYQLLVGHWLMMQCRWIAAIVLWISSSYCNLQDWFWRSLDLVSMIWFLCFVLFVGALQSDDDVRSIQFEQKLAACVLHLIFCSGILCPRVWIGYSSWIPTSEMLYRGT